MTCTDCTASAERVWHGFDTGCNGCAARAASRSPEFRNAQIVRVLSKPYRLLLERLQVTHAQAKDAHAADILNKVRS